MKKRNIIFVFALLLTILLPKLVSAAPSSQSWEVYCGDIGKTVTREDPVRCYLITQITNDPATGLGIYGALTGVQLKNLVFESGNSAGVLDPAAVTVKPYANQTTSDTVANFTCNEPSGCFDFVAASEAVGIVDKKGQNTGDAEVQSFNADHSAYTIIGWYLVKLSDEATTENCGEICVYVRPLDVKPTDGSTPPEIGTPSLTNGLCKEIKPSIPVTPEKKTCYTEGEGDNKKYYGKDGNEVTKEQYDKDCGNPTTGGWASYAVLAAGAFIALSAITIAKKHNKFYQV